MEMDVRKHTARERKAKGKTPPVWMERSFGEARLRLQQPGRGTLGGKEM